MVDALTGSAVAGGVERLDDLSVIPGVLPAVSSTARSVRSLA